jgi:tripartite-type tricarboxylate transporter receptor subunit TctC
MAFALLPAGGLAATFIGNQKGGMMRGNHCTILAGAAVATMFAVESPAQAPSTGSGQAFPTRALRYIMPLPAGSETDVFARTLGRQLGETWGQQVVVENRPGGGTTIGADVVVKAPADGYMLLHAITAHVINATLYAKLPYDTQKDFACVTQIGNLYGLLLVHPSFPAKNVTELIRLAKARPGEITYATGGSGTANHIAAEALRIAAGIKIMHVPYKGTSQAILDVLPGRVPVLATILAEAVPYIQSGKLRVIASTSPKRAPSLPDVPTINESLPAYRAGVGLWSIVTRAGTPVAVLNKLNADIVKALQTPDVRARLAQADIEIVGSRPEQCDAFLREQTAVWGEIVKASGARVD